MLSLTRLAFLLASLVLTIAPAFAQDAEQSTIEKAAAFTLPPPGASPTKPRSAWATYYFIHNLNEDPEGIPLYDTRGNPISPKISPRDWCDAAIEGTARFTENGKTITLNYAKTGNKRYVNCAAVKHINPFMKPWIRAIGKSQFQKARGKYGDGVNGYNLVPFRTIAVDKNVVPYGSVVYIEAARGTMLTLPDGSRIEHDGYFFAADTGGGITGKHIDMFCGIEKTNCFPSFVKSASNHPFTLRLISDMDIQNAFKTIHRTSID